MSLATIEPFPWTLSVIAHIWAGYAITCLALAIVWYFVSLERSLQLAFLGVLALLIITGASALAGDDVPRPGPLLLWIERIVGVGGGLATAWRLRHHSPGHRDTTT